MTDLDKLIEAVEAGKCGTWFSISQAIQRPASGDEVRWVQAAADGSLDAAKRLHDALLPGSARVNDLSQDGNGRWWIVIACDIPPHYFHGNDPNPARAWLLAILRAKTRAPCPDPGTDATDNGLHGPATT